jgi:AcrR family transcriptional regulator
MANETKLTVEGIVEAAFQLADEEGLEQLSMRKLAERLGVQAMSLYYHIKDKDTLLAYLVERLVAEMTLPQVASDWKDTLRHRARSMHAVLKRHRWGTIPLVSGFNVGPMFLRYTDRTLQALTDAGFTHGQADRIIGIVNAYVYGTLLHELNFPIAEEDYQTAAQNHPDVFPPSVYPALYALQQDIALGRYSGMLPLELGLDVVLTGIEHHIKQPRR